MPNKYIYAIKPKTRGCVAPEGEWFNVYALYLGMLYVICVTEKMQLCVQATFNHDVG